MAQVSPWLGSALSVKEPFSQNTLGESMCPSAKTGLFDGEALAAHGKASWPAHAVTA